MADADARAILNAHGLRATPSRRALLHLLRSRRTAFTHAEVADMLPDEADRATWHRNLADLVEVGLARRFDVGDRIWRFESTTLSPHAHFVCAGCARVDCLDDIDLVVGRARVPRALRQHRVEIALRGRCDTCSGRKH